MTDFRTWALAAALAFALGGCVQSNPLIDDLMSFQVTSAQGHADQDFGTSDAPLPFVSGSSCASKAECQPGEVCVATGQCAREYHFDVRAIGRDGKPFPYSGPLHLRVTPGQVLDSDATVMMAGGKVEDVTVHIARGLGPTHVWVEADGYLPKPADQTYGQCSDGLDNDGNGLIDMADPGCQSPDDDLEAPVGDATGVSPTIHFTNPTVHDIEATDKLAVAPLDGQQVRVRSGTLVVTNVVANGFYVTDLADSAPDRLYNSIFIFTFSKPEQIFYGDSLCGFSGAVQEYVGMTQVVFPNFTVYAKDNPACADFPGLDPTAKPPAPVELTPMLLEEDRAAADYLPNVYANALLMEKYEASLVTFSNVQVSDRFIACDKNDNGQIDKGTDEITCRSDCQVDPLCTDLESYFQYSQYAGLTGDKKKIYGSVAGADGFSPLGIDFIGDADSTGRCTFETTDAGFAQYSCDPLTLTHLTGSLRQIYLCGAGSNESRCDLQFWVVDPRFNGDVEVAPAATP